MSIIVPLTPTSSFLPEFCSVSSTVQARVQGEEALFNGRKTVSSAPGIVFEAELT
jgi:hypothetical protein